MKTTQLLGLVVLCLMGVLLAVSITACGSIGRSVTPEQAARSQAAFEVVASVLRHPRCMNCHTNTDFVRVSDDRIPHRMNVVRGPKNKGVPGMSCGTCHQSENQEVAGVPGAPHWSAAPLSMGWEGLDDHDLAKALLDRRKNGNRSHADLLKHMRQDPLVLWGWAPGSGRTTPPVDHAAFVREFEAWIENGAVLPEPGQTTY